jgi:carbamoyl-phosphate synthase small subunit
MPDFSGVKKPDGATGVLITHRGDVFWGKGFGAASKTVGEICFTTGMTGYQETLSDPSFAGQIITFTFPHIGNVGTNAEDIETVKPAARGMIVREDITAPSSWRSQETLQDWLVTHHLVGLCGIDTRALTRLIRDQGAPNGVLCHAPDGVFDLNALYEEAKSWAGLDGMDLAKSVTCPAPYTWTEGAWDIKNGYAQNGGGEHHVVAVDFGMKRNILRCLVAAGCRVTVVPAHTSANDILALKPDGVFLSNGPGDPAATGDYAVPMVRGILDSAVPLFGICLGHQILALALGGRTQKMHLGHRGANHPVKDLTTGKVEITSQNHGFCVLPDTLPDAAEVTHVSLFDGSNEGLRLKNRPVFSVQYHPEASPGPQDSHYLFERFTAMMGQK